MNTKKSKSTVMLIEDLDDGERLEIDDGSIWQVFLSIFRQPALGYLQQPSVQIG